MRHAFLLRSGRVCREGLRTWSGDAAPGALSRVRNMRLRRDWPGCADGAYLTSDKEPQVHRLPVSKAMFIEWDDSRVSLTSGLFGRYGTSIYSMQLAVPMLSVALFASTWDPSCFERAPALHQSAQPVSVLVFVVMSRSKANLYAAGQAIATARAPVQHASAFVCYGTKRVNQVPRQGIRVLRPSSVSAGHAMRGQGGGTKPPSSSQE